MTDVPEDDRFPRTVGVPETVARAFDELPVLAAACEGPKMRFVATSALFRASLGRSEVIGVPLREAFAEMQEQLTLDLWDEVYATGQPAVQREYRAQTRAEDGTLIELFLDFVIVPMRAPDGTVTGVVATGTDVTAAVQERRAAEERAGEAQRRYVEARDVVRTLQQELLPAGVPVLPCVRLAASYLLADADTAAGGDWYDAVTLSDGRVALVVGDVVGHGVAASAVMGQLRVVLRERLMATGDLKAAIGALDALAEVTRGAQAATVCVMVLDPHTGDLSYCTAGHPPPLLLLLPDGGEARYLPASGAGPLGTGSTFPVASEQLAVGDMILLYTDGILERPGRDLAGSSVELAQVAADVAAGRVFRGDSPWPVDRLATQTLEVLTRTTGHSDDITLLAAQRTDPPAGFSTRREADTAMLRDIRSDLHAWLTIIGASEQDVTAVEHAVDELVTNACEHAYVDSANRHEVSVSATLTATGRLQAEVRDQGRWRTPNPSPDRGLGLVMAGKLVDMLQLEHDETGTVAAVELELSRPAQVLTAADLASGVGTSSKPSAEPFLILEQPSAPSPRLRVDGPVDAHTTPELDNAVRFAGAAGTRELIVDLTGVTHLASAAVAALQKLSVLGNNGGGKLRLYAPPGSTADMILTLVNLAHETSDPHATTSPPPEPE